MKIAIVGEAPSDQDIEEGQLFTGAIGWHLDQMLSAAGINRRECLVTSVFNQRLIRGDVKNFCGPKGEAAEGLPPISRGKYLRREYAGEISRLRDEINSAAPNLILALGSTALWAFSGEIGIRQYRGVTRLSTCGKKLLPTYHPAAVLREWSLRPIVIADFHKAAAQAESPDYNPPRRRIHIEPTIRDLLLFEEKYFASAVKLACDIETKQEQITCIGFAPNAENAIVIPFFHHSGKNYWSSKEEELEAWKIIRRWLATYPTVFQNGIYDMSFLWRVYGIPAPRACDDTMLLHHALQPELNKGLGFLASLYTDEPSWKQMGKGQKHD
jgi:DNA polymerase